jgi:hypothetical protein
VGFRSALLNRQRRASCAHTRATCVYAHVLRVYTRVLRVHTHVLRVHARATRAYARVRRALQLRRNDVLEVECARFARVSIQQRRFSARCAQRRLAVARARARFERPTQSQLSIVKTLALR